MPELLEHVAQRRLGAGDADHLLVGEREDRRQVHAVGQLVQHRPQPGLDHLPHQLRRRCLQPQRLDGAEARHVHRVVEPVLDVAVQARHEAVPQAALGEDQEAQAVELVHRLNDAGEERLGDLVRVVAAPGQQQVLKLVKGDHDRDLEVAEDLHQHLEQRQHQIAAGRADLEGQLREAVGEEVGQRRLVAEQGRPAEAGEDRPTHQAGGVVRLGPLDVGGDQLARLFGGQAGLVDSPLGRNRGARNRGAGGEGVQQPGGAVLRAGAAQAELARPLAQALGREQGDALDRRHLGQRPPEQPAAQLVADEVQRPYALLPPAAEQRINNLIQQVFEEVGVLLVDAGGDEQLPSAFGAVLDRVQQVRLAGPLVAEHRHDLGVGGRVVAVQVHDAEQLVALGGEQLGDVVAGADLVVGVAGEVVAERVAGAAQGLQGPVGQRAVGDGGGHGFPPRIFSRR